MTLLETMNWRYATKRMTNQKVSKENIAKITETIRLSPSAYGLQPYSIIVSNNKDFLNKVFEKACPQTVIQQCSHLIIFKTLKNITTEYINQYLQKLQQERNVSNEYREIYRSKINSALKNAIADPFEWAKHQTYLALGVGTIAAAELQIDATPIEGFNPDELNKILKLDTNKEETTVLLTLGYRDAVEDQLSGQVKIRKSKEEFIKII